jgi:hypothetical protein
LHVSEQPGDPPQLNYFLTKFLACKVISAFKLL